WPEKRGTEPGLDGIIMRTTERSWLKIPIRYIPAELSSLFGFWPAVSRLLNSLPTTLKDPLSRLFDEDGIFKIPTGFPINLTNFQPLVDIDNNDLARRAEHVKNVEGLALELKKLGLPDPNASDEKLLDWWKNLRKPLLKLSKCPDFVVNRGHYFGTAEF